VATKDLKAIDWNNFKVDDLGVLEKSPESLFLVHFVQDQCDKICETDKEFVKKYQATFQQIKPELTILTGKFAKGQAKNFGVNGTSALMVMYKGHAVRVDNNGPILHQKPVEEIIKSILVREPLELKDEQELSTAMGKKEGIRLFYGNSTSKYWNSIVLASKYLEDDIYYTMSKELTQKLDMKRKGTFYFIPKEANRSLQLLDKPIYENLVKFAEITSYQVPLQFDAQILKEVKAKAYPVMFFMSTVPENNRKLKYLLDKHEEGARTHFLVMEINDLKDKEQKEIYELCTPEDTPKDNVVCILDYLYDENRPLRFIYQWKTVTEKKLVTFILSYIDGTMRPYHKNEPLNENVHETIKSLNTRTLPQFMEIKGNANSYVAVHFYSQKTSQNDKDVIERVAKRIPEDRVRLGRYNIDLNEPTESEGFYFGGAWESGHMIKFEGKWTPEEIQQWAEKLAEEQDRIYAEKYPSTTDL
jgi:hypothetical protein